MHEEFPHFVICDNTQASGKLRTRWIMPFSLLISGTVSQENANKPIHEQNFGQTM